VSRQGTVALCPSPVVPLLISAALQCGHHPNSKWSVLQPPTSPLPAEPKHCHPAALPSLTYQKWPKKKRKRSERVWKLPWRRIKKGQAVTWSWALTPGTCPRAAACAQALGQPGGTAQLLKDFPVPKVPKVCKVPMRTPRSPQGLQAKDATVPIGTQGAARSSGPTHPAAPSLHTHTSEQPN